MFIHANTIHANKLCYTTADIYASYAHAYNGNIPPWDVFITAIISFQTEKMHQYNLIGTLSGVTPRSYSRILMDDISILYPFVMQAVLSERDTIFRKSFHEQTSMCDKRYTSFLNNNAPFWYEMINTCELAYGPKTIPPKYRKAYNRGVASGNLRKSFIGNFTLKNELYPI